MAEKMITLGKKGDLSARRKAAGYIMDVVLTTTTTKMQVLRRHSRCCLMTLLPVTQNGTVGTRGF